jgi:hypothetical protein
MADIKKIREQFKSKGYALNDNYKIPNDLLWQPDLIVSKNDLVYFVLVKSNNSIPPSYLDRISKIPKGKVNPLIIFEQKLKNIRDEEAILSLGISVAYFKNGRLGNFKLKKRKPLGIVKQEVQRKLNVIDIFISSKQDISERKFVKSIIEKEREVNYYPFNPPHLIEYDRFNMRSIYRHIDRVIDVCEWVIILLEDNDSPYVRYEINKSIKTKRAENIFLFVKLTKQCQDMWEKELKKVKTLKSIHYITYSDLNELEVNLRRHMKSQMNKICKKRKVELFI